MNCAVIGTSPYKQDLLLSLMAEDFDRRFTLIDTDGTLAQALANIIPTELTEDTFYFDASDFEHPPGFNIFSRATTPEKKDQLTADMCALYDTLVPEAPNTLTHKISRDLLAASVRVLLDGRHATFLSIFKLLRDPDYRLKAIRECTNPIVTSSWDTLLDMKDFEARAAALESDLNQLLLSSTVQNILCQADSTFSFNTGKIVIINLNRRTLGANNARALANIFLAVAEPPVYIADLDFLASDRLSSTVAADGYTVSVQFLNQLPPKLQQAVLSMSDKRAFRCTPQDARTLEPYLPIADPLEVTTLPYHHYISEAGRVRILPLRAGDRLPAIVKRSRACHTRPRQLIEKQIRDFLASKDNCP